MLKFKNTCNVLEQMLSTQDKIKVASFLLKSASKDKKLESDNFNSEGLHVMSRQVLDYVDDISDVEL